MQSTLHALPVLQDNVIWIWTCGSEAVVVDPAVADPVRNWLQERHLTLTTVLQTHHHADHIGGTPELMKIWPGTSVIAAARDRSRIPFQTVSVTDNSKVSVMGRELLVMDVAAHTSAHIAFFLPEASDSSVGPLLFCGDTLFAGGCGRLFEGTPKDMHRALQRFSSLPSSTKVCCAHEYTEGNLRWAVEIRPEDVAIKTRYQEVGERRAKGELTLPSSIEVEQRTNLFMQANSAEELGQLRQHKDHWRAT